jgi:GT2 family glycosyltransferase
MKIMFFNHEQYVNFEEETGNYELRLLILNCGLVTSYRDYVYQRVLRSEGREAMDRKALQEVENFNPDLVVYSTTWPHESLSPDVLGEIMRRGTPVYTHVWDTHIVPAPHELRWFNNCTFFGVADSITNFLHYRRLAEGQPNIRGCLFAGGHNVFTDIFSKQGLNKAYDVTVLGSNEGLRAELIHHLCGKLAPYGISVSKFGGLVDSTKKASSNRLTDKWVPWETYVKIINQSKILLSSQTDAARCQIKGKIFQFLASGAFCLSDLNSEVNRIIPKECLVYYDGFEDCLEKIIHYMRHEDERTAIAQAGHDWFHSTFNYKKFWSQFLRAAVIGDVALPGPTIMELVSEQIPERQNSPTFLPPISKQKKEPNLESSSLGPMEERTVKGNHAQQFPVNFSIPKSIPGPGKQSAEELFALGNYAGTAMKGNDSDWQTYAAMGLIGKTQAALEGLPRFDHPEARFYLGVTHWINGQEDMSVRLLEGIPTPHARNLLALIRKPQIQVLAQLPYTRMAPHDLLTAAAQDKKFKVQNISFHPQDLPNEPYADIHKFFSPQRPPDFFICQMVEWHLIAPNLQQLPCPIFGATADYDLHIQAVYPWLQLFDELIVTDPTEWEDVSRLVRVPVSVFPKSFGIPDNLPAITSSPRVLDVFLSGSLNHPYFAEKALLLNQLLRMKGIRARFIDGFLLNGFYYSALGNSKVSFTHIRHPGSMPTRGLEALSMGCAVVVQKGSVLTLYAGEEEGVLTYDSEGHNLVPAIRRTLDDWPEFEKRARRGAEIIRREFSLPRVASQYLRFLTYLAAKPRNQRGIKTPIPLDQKRMVLWKGWVPAPQPVFSKIRKQNLDRWQTRVKSEKNPRLFVDMARELVLEYAAVAVGIHTVPDKRQLLDRAFQLYRAGIGEFPDSLVLRFNQIRTALHFGRPKDRAAALKLAGETLNSPEEFWQVAPLDDVFPWDFFNTFFNYRSYFDRVTEHFTRGTEVRGSLVRLLLASMHSYRGHYSESLEDLKRATELDPEFPFYKLNYAQRLVERGRSEDYKAADDLLCQLAENSMVFEEAFRLLEKIQSQRLYICPQFEDLARKMDQAERCIRLVDPRNYFSFLKPKGKALPLSSARSKKKYSPVPPGVDSSTDQNNFVPTPSKEYLVSALVPTYNAGRFMRGLLEDLEAQTIAGRMEMVIVDTGSPTGEKEIVEEFQKKYGNIVYIRTEHRESSHSAINRCIRAARGKYVTLACTDDRHKEDALERMVAVLESRPDVALVYGNMHITAFENETFDNFTPGGIYRWADFDPRLLLQGCFAGPQPMWRKNLHEKYGFLDETLESAGDWEFWLRLAERETFLHIDEFLGLYLFSPTSSEHKNPELSRKEAEIVRQRYIHREPHLAERKRRAEKHQLADSGILVLALRGTGTDEELSSLVEQVRNQPSAQGEPSVKVVRIHGEIPENGLGVTVSPPTPTVLQALHQGVDWEGRYVVLLSADVTLPPAVLDSLIAIAESEPSIAAVGPVSNEAPDAQKVRQFLPGEGSPEDLAGRLASRYGKDWKEVPYLGTFCLLLKSDAVRKAGGVRDKLSVPVAMWQLFGRLRSRGFKVVCAPGIYVPHRKLTPEEGKKFIELQAAEEGLREGERKFAEGALKEAEEAFRRILRDFPDHPEANNDLACLLWQTGRREEALKALLKIMIMVPDHRDIIWNLGQFFKEMGRDREAFQVYRNYSALHPEEQEMVEIMNQWTAAGRAMSRMPECSQELPGRSGPA